MTETEFLKIYDNEGNFEEQDLKDFVLKNADTFEENSGKFKKHLTSIFKVDNRTFLIKWQKGLIEKCKDLFERPVEVNEGFISERVECIKETEVYTDEDGNEIFKTSRFKEVSKS